MRTPVYLLISACLLLAACGATLRSPESDPPSDSIILDIDQTTENIVPRPPAFAGPRSGSVEDFVISAGERVYFNVNQYNLDVEDRAILQRQAAWLRNYPSVTILISGNADERGTREYNLALGARRAAAIKDYLISIGINPARVETISYGKERPLDPDHNRSAWGINRNAHTQITGGAVGG